MASNTPKPLCSDRLTSDELRFLTKKPGYNNLLIDTHELAKRVSLSNPRQWTSVKTPCPGLGMLDKLPVELQFQLFSMTPISALFDLRATNSHAKHMIEMWGPFRTVMNEGANAVRALLATGAGNMWTTEQVADGLFTTTCELCGEHGEILQLLKLKRCCFRCLSQERELLAVTENYASNVMKLSSNELAKFPLLRSLPQKSFWGYPAVRRGWLFDYSAALDASRQQPRSQDSQPAPLVTFQPSPLQRTGHSLAPDERSIQPLPTSTIQARRRQQTIHLLANEVSPPETIYAQHACAIRLPAKTRHVTRIPSGGLHTKITAVEAVHCAGCAFYWNYHSPLPYQFHRLYPHEKGVTDTPLTRHLAHCIYAHLQWSWLHNPWRESRPEDIINRNSGPQMQTRTGERPGHKENARFEEIPLHVQGFLELHDLVDTSFTMKYTWPEAQEGLPASTLTAHGRPRPPTSPVGDNEAPSSPIMAHDHYWDCLVSQEAVSQSNWACANMANGRMCLFAGPVSVLLEKHARLLMRGCPLREIGLNEMYL